MQGVSKNSNGNKPLSGSNIDLFLALQKIALLNKKKLNKNHCKTKHTSNLLQPQ